MVLAGLVFIASPTRAQQESCDGTSTPDLVQDNSDVNYQFSFTNSDPTNPIDWITITTPSSTFDIESESADGWSSYLDSTGAEFIGNQLQPGDTLTLNLEVNTGPYIPGEMDWGIYGYTGSSPSGPGNFVCQATPVTEMVNITPYISDVNLSDVTPSSVMITWTTSLPATTQVNYGFDDTYGSSSPVNNNLITSHRVTLNHLVSNSGYHYQVVSTTPTGGEDSSADNTFLTAESLPAAPPPASSAPAPSASTAPIGITITKPSDKTPPKIAFTNLPGSEVFKSLPTLGGQASDAVALQRIEYSTDNGLDWLPVNSAPGLGTAQTSFSFTPVNLPDGTYKVLARAINDGGYSGVTSTITIVIDRLPPILGGNFISLGPQILQPGSQGVITSLAGVDQKITTSTVGGPTDVSLVARPSGKNPTGQTFNLTQSPDSLLWSGIISISNPGLYDIVSNAVDGAGITTNQTIGAINVVSDPHTFARSNGKPLPSVITLYYLDSDSHSWVVWDGSSYSESNPQSTDSHGNFKLFVPPGTYYIKAASPGYQTLLTSIFKVSQSQPITVNLGLRRTDKLSLGPVHWSLPTLAGQTLNPAALPSAGASDLLSRLVGKQLPDFTLAETNGSMLSSAALLGRPTLITLGSTWSPSMAEQLPALSQLQSNPAINVLPVAMQQSATEVSAYTSIAGLNLNWLVDPDSTLSAAYGAPYLPTQLFVDRNGIIRTVIAGVLTKSQIDSHLSGL